MNLLKLLIVMIVLSIAAVVYVHFKSPEGINSHPTSMPTPSKSISPTQSAKSDLIRVEAPKPNSEISSPLEIKGEARGPWFFEGVFPINLVDDQENVIAQGQAKAKGEWTTENFVPFEVTIEFTTDAKKGKLILEKDNPSGDPSKGDSIDIPVVFSK